jgi:hypothetical protein
MTATFYLIMFLVNILIGAYAIFERRWWLVYLCTWGVISCLVFYIEKAWGLLK